MSLINATIELLGTRKDFAELTPIFEFVIGYV